MSYEWIKQKYPEIGALLESGRAELGDDILTLYKTPHLGVGKGIVTREELEHNASQKEMSFYIDSENEALFLQLGNDRIRYESPTNRSAEYFREITAGEKNVTFMVCNSRWHFFSCLKIDESLALHDKYQETFLNRHFSGSEKVGLRNFETFRKKFDPTYNMNPEFLEKLYTEIYKIKSNFQPLTVNQLTAYKGEIKADFIHAKKITESQALLYLTDALVVGLSENVPFHIYNIGDAKSCCKMTLELMDQAGIEHRHMLPNSRYFLHDILGRTNPSSVRKAARETEGAQKIAINIEEEGKQVGEILVEEKQNGWVEVDCRPYFKNRPEAAQIAEKDKPGGKLSLNKLFAFLERNEIGFNSEGNVVMKGKPLEGTLSLTCEKETNLFEFARLPRKQSQKLETPIPLFRVATQETANSSCNDFRR